MKEKLFVLIQENILVSIIGVIGIVFLLIGLFTSLHLNENDSTKQVLTFNDTQTRSEEKKKVIYVDVSGSVLKPGVYALDTASRIKDAIAMAGGLSPEADKMKVSQTLNLAAKLSDGAKLYIPRVGEQMMTSQESNNSTSVISSSNTNGININQASATELEALPGIGKVTASKIIGNRPYQNINELVEKKVIGVSVFEKIKTKINTY